ncbi:hypothetical protein CBFG_01936 [Clostridiales bacterium 1_7_47FAA]|nr:hypothetical protein CBFG_01936 [Clostridiales bacterium 1_7_47FAA]
MCILHNKKMLNYAQSQKITKALTSFPERIMIISETAMKRMKQTAITWLAARLL